MRRERSLSLAQEGEFTDERAKPLACRDFVDNIDYERVSRTTLNYAEGAALGIFEFLFALVLIIVVCIYMLLDMPRLQRVLIPVAQVSTFAGATGYFAATSCETGIVVVLIFPGNFDFVASL